jgi:hypothetical protein
MREITENLHRSDLTALERSEQIEEWRILCEQNAKGGISPHPSERGVKKAARELKRDPKEIRDAEKIAKITPEAKNFPPAGSFEFRTCAKTAGLNCFRQGPNRLCWQPRPALTQSPV